MKISMIVMDMDGTLLNKDQKISDKTKQALLDAQEKGIKVVLASGRSYRTLLAYGDELLMPQYDGYFIGANGVAITSAKTMEHEVIKQLQLEDIERIFQAVEPFQIECMGVLDDTIYDYIPDSFRKIKKVFREENNIDEDVPWTAGTFSIIVDQRFGYSHIFDIQSYHEIPCPVNKICLAHNPEMLEKPYAFLMENLGKDYHFARTSHQWIECAPYGINKGNAIKKLATRLNIPLDQILVFGDGENDLTMFDAVKYPIAMGNAMDNVKKAAYEVTKTNNEDGIACFLKKYNIV